MAHFFFPPHAENRLFFFFPCCHLPYRVGNLSSCPGLHANMELTSYFSLFDEISHLFVKKRKGKTRALLHNVENGLGVASFRQKENAQVTWVWSSWCTRTDLVLGCSPKQAIPDSIFPLETHFFPQGWDFPRGHLQGRPATYSAHPSIAP